MIHLNKEEFGFVFDSLIAEAIAGGEMQNRVIDLERFKILEEVCVGISEVFGKGKDANLVVHPAFRSGGVSLKVASVKLNRDDVLKMAELLNLCTTFEIVPLTTGEVEVTATLNEVFKKIE